MTENIKSEVVWLVEQGKLKEAKKSCSKLCKKTPKDPEAWFLLGTVNGAIGDFPAAEYCCRKALKFAPQNHMLLFNLGIALLRQGKADEAIKQLKKAIKIQPQFADAYMEIANAFNFKGDITNSIINYEKTIQLNPGATVAYHHLAVIYQNSGQLSEAIRYYEHAIAIQDDFVDSYCGLATALIGQYKYDRTIRLLETNIQRLPETAYLYYCLAVAYQEQGEVEKAKAYYDKTLEIDSRYIDAQTGLAGILALQGEYKKAGEKLENIIKSHPDDSFAKIIYITYADRFGAAEKAIEMGVECLSNNKLKDKSRSKLLFALAKLYEQQGDLDIAFEHYHQANKLKNVIFDEQSYLSMFDSLITTYTADIFVKHHHEYSLSEKPVFIIGMPRSGTSLAEQILASHPDVFGAGELPAVNRMVDQLPAVLDTSISYPECLKYLDNHTLQQLASEYLEEARLKSDDEKFITDKMPSNFMHLGFISLMFPNARIIHCTRDPLDTCLSCFFQNFTGEHPYAYSLTSLGKFYRMYEKLMGHWSKVIPNPIYELSYEKIVVNPEQEIRSMIDFCGLEWNDKCLDFHQTKRTVATASHSQVRQKIYTSSVGKWRSYEKHLDELHSALELTG